MLKKGSKTAVIALILAAAMMISGCSNDNGTPQQTGTVSATKVSDLPADATAYIESLRKALNEYMNYSYDFADKAEESDIPGSKAVLDSMEGALKMFEEITPPERYTTQQKNIVDSLASEYEYINNCRKFLDICEKGDDLSEEDKAELDRINEALADPPDTFTSTLNDVVAGILEERTAEK